MRAIALSEYGGPEVLKLSDAATPSPGPNEALVKVAFAGVNFIDVYMRNGLYKRSHTYEQSLPLVPGMEGAGVIEALGSGTEGFAVGDRVAWCLERGSYAEFAAVPVWKLVKIPPGVSFEIATALQLQGSTAHYLCTSLFALEEGQTCLIHAGAGGLGQILIQMAKAKGAWVLTTVGSPEKAEIARKAGSDEVILYRETDFATAVLEMTGGVGVDVVYDSVGKDTILGSIRSVKRRGTISNNGNASGPIEALDPLALAEAGSVFFTRPHLADYIASAEERKWRAGELFELQQSGKLSIAIDRILPLEQAEEAHRLMEGRKSSGKILLAV